MLTLSILRCPDSMHPETRTLNGGEFRIGRGPENDWVLPDPAKTVSKHHCTVSYQGGGWELTDQSTNGSYLNRDARPVGRDRSRLLSDGDRLRFGPYEIEIHIAPDAATAPAPGDPFAASLPGASSFTQPRVLGPPPQLTPQSVALQADYDPVPPEPANPFDELPPQPDHTPSVDEAYRPPPVLAKVLPEDWDDFGLSPPKPSATPVAPPVTRVAEPVVPITPGVAISAPEPRENAAPQPLPPQGDLLAGFFRGAGLSDAHPADPAATMEALGAAFRALVSGLRQGLIARAGIKDLFRIERTIIRARGNNPLKFSADDDDALLALLGAGRRTNMGPAEAITDALRDMRLHELATIAAMQNAVRSLLGQMDPARIARENEASMALIPAQRKARAWDAYESLYARIVQALADDFDSVFGKAFARAYEKALGELSSHEGTPQKRTSESHRA